MYALPLLVAIVHLPRRKYIWISRLAPPPADNGLGGEINVPPGAGSRTRIKGSPEVFKSSIWSTQYILFARHHTNPHCLHNPAVSNTATKVYYS
uniref:Secreted protein n=1 Tax=Caenorhabditis tropicalis TaxID=1561998 RepID=A0A1I7U210_9PELO